MYIQFIVYMAKWSSEKNEILKRTRNISFEEIADAAQENLLDDIKHPNSERYPNQRIAIVRCKGYVYEVPYVIEDNGELFLKTIIPSRKALKKYGGKNAEKKKKG